MIHPASRIDSRLHHPALEELLALPVNWDLIGGYYITCQMSTRYSRVRSLFVLCRGIHRRDRGRRRVVG